MDATVTEHCCNSFLVDMSQVPTCNSFNLQKCPHKAPHLMKLKGKNKFKIKPNLAFNYAILIKLMGQHDDKITDKKSDEYKNITDQIRDFVNK